MNFNNSNFNTSNFDRNRSSFSVIKYVVIFLIAVIFIGYITVATKVKSSGRTLYTITVTNYNNQETYMSDSIVSQTANTVVFIDAAFGIKRTVTSPGISVTQY